MVWNGFNGCVNTGADPETLFCSAKSWREQAKYQWNDDEVDFVIDQHT